MTSTRAAAISPAPTPVTLSPSDHAHYTCDTLAELSKIHLAHANIAIAKRPVETTIVDYLTAVAAEPWGSLAIDVTSVDELDILAEELPKSEHHSLGRDALVRDMKRLASTYVAVSQAPKITVQISHITTDMCRLFHADHIDLRLLCTYAGKGTQWLTEDNTNRAGLGKGCNDNICRDPKKVRIFNTFDVGLLKGSRYPGNDGFGAVHRSPPIVGTDEPWRVMVKIDAIVQPTSPMWRTPQ